MVDKKLGYALAIWALVLVTTDVAAQIQPNTWLFRDGRFYLNVNENLLLRGSLEDPFAASWYNGELAWNHDLSADFSNVALGARGEHYHFRPWLLPILSTPLYFALGLLGVLLFNLLTYCVIAAGSYRFARAWAPPDAAALAAVAMVFASGFRHHAYNYSVDLLLTALFCAGLALLVERRGALAGALVAGAVMIKPTTLLYAPALALILWERRDTLTLKRAILGGTGVLALFACANTYMFGRPWWTGYNRVVVTVGGEPGVFTDADAFVTPFREGALELFSGGDGLLWWHGAFALALPGLVVLARRAPRTALGIAAAFAGAFYVFSKFRYHHDRFMFPAVALLVVPLALGIGWLARRLRAGVLERWRERARLGRAPVAAFVLALGVLGAAWATSPGPLASRVLDAGTVEGALLLAEGSLDVRDATSDVVVRMGESGSTASLGAGERWVPRAAPVALLVLAPLAALGGRPGVVLGSMLAAALAVAFATRLLSRSAPAPLAAAIAVGALLVGPGREAALGDPAGALAAMGLVGALALAVQGSRGVPWAWTTAGALAVLGGSCADAPLAGLVVAAAVLFLGWQAGGASMTRAVVGSAAALAVHGALLTAFFGSPLGSPDDLVVISPDGALASVPHTTALDALEAIATGGPSSSRALLPLLFFLLPGVLLARSLGARVAIAALVGALVVPNVAASEGRATLFCTLALALPAGMVASALAERIAAAVADLGPRRALGGALGVALALCLAVGLVRRAAAAEHPLWIGTPASVRAAEVRLGDVPCDFLAWENMAWECSFYDGGAMGRVGLALPEGPTIDGRVVRNMLLVPTGERSHEPRVVTWRDVPVGPRLLLVVGAPDGFDADADVRVRIDGEEVALFTVARSPRGLVEHVVETSRLEGEVDLEIDMRAVGRARRAAILVAGGFVDAPRPR